MDLQVLEECQEAILRNRIGQEGGLRDLLYFLFVKRDFDSIDELEASGEIRRQDVQRMLDVIALARGAIDAEALAARLDDEHDPWLHYTVAKSLLGNGKIQQAITAASRYLRLFHKDGLLLNLVAKHLVSQKERGLALQIIDSSLRLNPAQGDIVALRKCVLSDEPWPVPLYLDPQPLHVPVAFYVPIYNVERYIRQAIEGLLGQSYPIAEIIAVDDGTPDRSIEIAMEYPVRIVRHECNRGLAAARNTALRNTTAEYVGSVDSDAVPDAGYTKYVMMEYENPCSGLAGVGGRLIEAFGDTAPDLWRKTWLGQDPGPARECPPKFLYGSNTILRREAVLDVGGYGDQFRTNNEDVQLCGALTARGYTFAHMPWAITHHHRRDTLQSVLKTKWNWLYWNRVQDGTFESSDTLFAQIGSTFLESVHMVLSDCQAGRSELPYIDFLWMVVDAILNAAQAARIERISTLRAHDIQEAMLDTVRRLDLHFGGTLCEKVRADASGFLINEERGTLAGEFDGQPALDGILKEIERVYLELGVGVYRAIAG